MKLRWDFYFLRATSRKVAQTWSRFVTRSHRIQLYILPPLFLRILHGVCSSTARQAEPLELCQADLHKNTLGIVVSVPALMPSSIPATGPASREFVHFQSCVGKFDRSVELNR